MDLAGPKLRTGPIHRGHHVVRWRVERDTRGAAISPARIALAGRHADPGSFTAVDAVLPVPETVLRLSRAGDTVRVADSGGKKRDLTVIDKVDHARICTCEQGAYVLSRAELSLRRGGSEIATGPSAPKRSASAVFPS